jgi:hypothetical protein
LDENGVRTVPIIIEKQQQDLRQQQRSGSSGGKGGNKNDISNNNMDDDSTFYRVRPVVDPKTTTRSRRYTNQQVVADGNLDVDVDKENIIQNQDYSTN